MQIEFVAYGPRLHLLREDKSPVKRPDQKHQSRQFSIERKVFGLPQHHGWDGEAGRSCDSQATFVPAGVVRLSELQEQGWSYIRP